jgi:hypothetical protein
MQTVGIDHVAQSWLIHHHYNDKMLRFMSVKVYSSLSLRWRLSVHFVFVSPVLGVRSYDTRQPKMGEISFVSATSAASSLAQKPSSFGVRLSCMDSRTARNILGDFDSLSTFKKTQIYYL